MFLSIFFNKTKNPDVAIRLNGFKPHKRTIAVIYEVGIPSIIMQSISSVMTFGMNRILIMLSLIHISCIRRKEGVPSQPEADGPELGAKRGGHRAFDSLG